MEHSEREIIRMKVLHAEQSEPVWDRSMVWSAIRLPSQRHNRSWIYYAAASLLISGSLAFFTYESASRTAMDIRLRSLELAILQEGNRSMNARSMALPQVETCPGVPIATKQKVRARPQTVEAPPAAHAPVVSVTVTEFPPVQQLPEQSISIIESEKQEITPSPTFNSIRPVFGRITEVNPESGKSRKFKFQLFPRDKDARPVDSADQFPHDLVAINPQP